jgi:hypothetical protein
MLRILSVVCAAAVLCAVQPVQAKKKPAQHPDVVYALVLASPSQFSAALMGSSAQNAGGSAHTSITGVYYEADTDDVTKGMLGFCIRVQL